MNICTIINDWNVLHCPICGSDNLHQIVTTVFTGTEDSPRMKIEIEQENISVCISDEGNPSKRRNGLKILFYCEKCGENTDCPELFIYQHKGQTFVEWSNK